jgi:hypothetical protein
MATVVSGSPRSQPKLLRYPQSNSPGPHRVEGSNSPESLGIDWGRCSRGEETSSCFQVRAMPFRTATVRSGTVPFGPSATSPSPLHSPTHQLPHEESMTCGVVTGEALGEIRASHPSPTRPSGFPLRLRAFARMFPVTAPKHSISNPPNKSPGASPSHMVN